MHRSIRARGLVVLGLLVVLLLAVTSGQAPLAAWPAQPDAPVQVTPTTLSDGADGIDIRFPNGHRLQWTTTGCDLAGWRDPQGTLLATGLVLQVNGTTQPSNLIYTGYTVSGDSATVDCTGGLAGGNVPARFTFRGQTRIWGVPYQGVSWQLTIDGSAVDGAPSLGNVTIGLTSLNYDGSVYGFQHYHMDPVWDGLSQYNMSNALSTVGASDDNQTF